MRTQEEILLFTLDQLDALRIFYYVTGSIAVGVYGKPRFTHDVDIVVSLHPAQIPLLVQQLQNDFYISAEGLQHALTHHSMANLIHHASGLKIDLWMLNKENEYSRTQCERRQQKDAFGRKLYFISPEDLVLQKLLWFTETQAERDWNDIVGIWEFLHTSLDMPYIRSWSDRLSLTHLFQKLTKPS